MTRLPAVVLQYAPALTVQVSGTGVGVGALVGVGILVGDGGSLKGVVPLPFFFFFLVGDGVGEMVKLSSSKQDAVSRWVHLAV